jgi:hypothetical protein
MGFSFWGIEIMGVVVLQVACAAAAEVSPRAGRRCRDARRPRFEAAYISLTGV